MPALSRPRPAPVVRSVSPRGGAPIVRPRPRRVAVPMTGHAAQERAATAAPLARLRARCQGRTVFVLASGPSLTAADVAAVRATGAPVIVTNTSFRLAPWADALFAQDRKWVAHYRAELVAGFQGLVFSGQPVSGPHGAGLSVTNLRHLGIDTYRNSGAGAIALAIHAGAARVVCLGLDGQPAADGASHWHGAHPPGLGNAVSMPLWGERLAQCAAFAAKRGVPVLNASRATALACFPRVALEEILRPDRQAGWLPPC